MIKKPDIHAIRLTPGQDLKKSLHELVQSRNIQAGWIISCVGSLTQYHLRFANKRNGALANGYYEIISLSGTLSTQGSHLHLAISDENGRVTAGHLLDGCTIYTTAEIIIGESADWIFAREADGTTEWKELQIKNR